ncbi:MAG: glycosyltransferase family 39 protein [bacterium]
MIHLVRHKTHLILLIILVVSGIVRFWGINFGLPSTECRPDESTVMQISLRFFTGDLNPHFFNYPSFYMYLLFFVYIGYFLIGTIFGMFTSLSYFVASFIVYPSSFYLINRFIVACMGILTVFIVYKITLQLFNKKTALIATLFCGLAYLHVRESHFGVTDIPTTLFIMCSMMYIIKSQKHRTLKNFIIAGLFAGLATSTKYTGILLFIPMFFVHLFNIIDNNDKKIKLFFDKKILLFSGTTIFVFLITNPFIILNFSKFIADLMFEIDHLNRGHIMILNQGWWYHLKFSLFFGLGWSLLFSSLLGFLLLIKVNIRKFIILCSFPCIYYILTGKGYTVFLRYIIPVIPFLCITSAFLIGHVSDKLFKSLKPRLNYGITYLLAVLIITPSAYSITRFNSLLTKQDNRLTTKKWIEMNIKEGSSIYQTGDKWGKIQLHPTLGTLKQTLSKLSDLYESKGRHDQVLKSEIDYLIAQIYYFKKKHVIGYDCWQYDSELKKFKYNYKYKNTLPDYIIIQESPLTAYSKVHKKIMESVRTAYNLRKAFKVSDVRNKENLFDQQDCFFIPYVGFKDVTQPGPNYYIFEKKSHPPDQTNRYQE